jgi:uncharacterized protein YyaL (SSP411 family)
VRWVPFSEEAFAAAKAADKPLIISVGYSACHWCHVMEHESFEDEQVAEIMNKYYVCVKVDREERADVDTLYMQAVQLMTGTRRVAAQLLCSSRWKAILRRNIFFEEAMAAGANIAG